MHAIDTATAVNNKFVDADPLAGVAGTEVDASWLNDVQGNLLDVLAQAEIEPVDGNYEQLTSAILALIAAEVPNEAAIIAAVLAAIAAAGGAGGGSGTPAPIPNQVAPFGMPTRATLPTPDLNALNQSGFWAAPTGTANIPVGATAGVVFAIGNTASTGADGAQLFIATTAPLAGPTGTGILGSTTPAAGPSGSIWVRAMTGGAWGAWISLTPLQPFYVAGLNGAKWDPHTGDFEQWGEVNGDFPEQLYTINFPYAFDTCYGVQGTVLNPAANVNIGQWIDEYSVSGASATVLINRVSSGTPDIPGFKWRARGVRASYPIHV